MSKLQFLTRKEVDVQKWDDAITRAENSLPYAFSWYLDIVGEHWDALILGDYETIMPLVWLRKFGFKCLYQPYYCQQLGVFGKNLSKEVQCAFLQYITQKYSYININLNPYAVIVAPEFGVKPKKNLLLDLSRPYVDLKKDFSENHRRSIQKAVKANIVFSEKEDLFEFQRFYLENVNRDQQNFKSKHELIFKRLTELLIKRNAGQIISALNPKGELLAASFIVRHQNRLINIINTTSAVGKKIGASPFLFDKFIQQQAEKGMVLDFEGSSIPGIARFYEGFGAEKQTFFNYQSSLFREAKTTLSVKIPSSLVRIW